MGKGLSCSFGTLEIVPITVSEKLNKLCMYAIQPIQGSWYSEHYGKGIVSIVPFLFLFEEQV